MSASKQRKTGAGGRAPMRPGLFCPNCSMPRRPIHFNGEVYTCTNCWGWWHVRTVRDNHRLFAQGGPAGYDPQTGFEAQAR